MIPILTSIDILIVCKHDRDNADERLHPSWTRERLRSFRFSATKSSVVIVAVASHSLLSRLRKLARFTYFSIPNYLHAHHQRLLTALQVTTYKLASTLSSVYFVPSKHLQQTTSHSSSDWSKIICLFLTPWHRELLFCNCIRYFSISNSIL
jgi:hypothetical protein